MSVDQSGNDGSQGKGAANAPPKEPNNNRTLVTAALFVVILLLIALAAYLYLQRDTRPDVWEEATVPYDETACEEDACEVFAAAAAGHGGHGSEGAIEFYYNPAIDDEIAQWGDCLGAFQVCVENSMQEASQGGQEADPVSIINGCVAAAAACPAECRSHFAERAAGRDLAALETLYIEVFEAERGYCVPREADQ